ncbi:patatin-like phospholipase family protein [Undibacterium sp. Ji50W]|uniref:patatin-like phospholipase family protein n=1 Tax=Undibacterium sp. Ji50W TaxID=3413041 RepID=UPI003BF0D42D
MDDQTFEIGLVGAGAISAGAYTAGVVDFMVVALDAWYAAKAAGDVPPHDVRLSVFSGASAGSISAALGAAYLGSDQPSIATEQDAENNQGKNRLFDSWVDRIDISSLLESRDLADKDSKVISILDSSILRDIADSGLDVVPRQQKRAYVADNFELILTVTNLRGVPYAFELQGSAGASYDMSLHADHIQFRFSDRPQEALPDRYLMPWQVFAAGKDDERTERLKLAALASAAFPVGLAPRTLQHVIQLDTPPDVYSARLWDVPTPETEHPHQCFTEQPIPANWKPETKSFNYPFQCVDGGVMNNEPLELARNVLCGNGGRNKRDGREAKKAVLLIDPFPSNSSFDPAEQPAPDLLKTTFKLFAALKNQARFKPDELMLALHEDVFSRFLIAPRRGDSVFPIACGSLGGFGGFLKRDFRKHDYFLGRRNMQQFLRCHFVLPEKNTLFVNWTEEQRQTYCVKDHQGKIQTSADGQRYLPIIPLVAVADTECYEAPWPAYSQSDLAQLTDSLENRLDVLLDHLVDQYFDTNHALIRYGAKLFFKLKKPEIIDYASKVISKDLKKMKLMA